MQMNCLYLLQVSSNIIYSLLHPVVLQVYKYLFILCALQVVITYTKIRYLNVIKSCIADRGLEKI